MGSRLCDNVVNQRRGLKERRKVMAFRDDLQEDCLRGFEASEGTHSEVNANGEFQRSIAAFLSVCKLVHAQPLHAGRRVFSPSHPPNTTIVIKALSAPLVKVHFSFPHCHTCHWASQWVHIQPIGSATQAGPRVEALTRVCCAVSRGA